MDSEFSKSLSANVRAHSEPNCSDVWFNRFNRFEKYFISEAVANLALGIEEMESIIDSEKERVMDWVLYSDLFQAFNFPSRGLGIVQDLTDALESFLFQLMSSKFFKERVAQYKQD
jgi:hypothetical protein